MPAFPLTINGHTYTEADFAPYGYVVNFPALVSDVSEVVAAAIPAAEAAAASETAAASNAATALDAKNDAETARTAAETAAALAFATNRVYVSTAAGISGTTSGQYFFVPQASPNQTLLDLYRNNAGTAQYINTAPSKASVDTIAAILQVNSPAPPAFQADITMFVSTGSGISGGGPFRQSSTARFNNIMFNIGLSTPFAGAEPASFVPLVEDAANNTESPIPGTLESAWERIEAENLLPYTSAGVQFFASIPAGGASSDTSDYIKANNLGFYPHYIDDLGDAKTIANAANKTLRVGAVLWTGGEPDYTNGVTKATYKGRLDGLATDMGADAATVTGQTPDVPILCLQSSRHVAASPNNPYIALATLELADEADNNIYIACPGYMFSYTFGTIVGAHSKWLGGYFGLAYKRIVLDGEDFYPLSCSEAYLQGRVIFLRFNVPYGSLVLDTTQVAAQTDYGFSVVNSVGAPVTISSVTIAAPDIIRIVTATSPGLASRVRYGFGGAGNLRDSQGDRIVFNPTGINKRLDNWCVIFEKAL